ncbi:MAG: hypothetical protein JJU40_04420, partial [Rhodobacteraceae bacterium]|nr:hypothetical protein [Paracoccaceae bacterium]
MTRGRSLLPALTLALGLALMLPGGTPPALAQETAEEERDRGRVVAFLEEQLSGAGREVRIEGFRGALAARMEMERLTIADAEGVWLTIRGATLDWNRLSVLLGRIEITALAADEIEIARAPVPEPGLPPAEAGGFTLPDLPVSVRIGRLETARLALGAPLLGEAVEARIAGSVSLAGGQASARLEVERTDSREAAARLSLDADGTEVTFALALQEDAGGLVSGALGIAGRPELVLDLSGEGPADDFAARFLLATDGVERLTGTARTEAAPGGGWRFAADISGDVTALFAPEYRPFFGPDVALEARGTRAPGGEVVLDNVVLRAAALVLEGRGAVAADGFPERLDVSGQLTPPRGETVLLPLPGDPVRVAAGRLQLAFDAARGPDWTGETTLTGVESGGLRLADLTLSGTGRIARETGDDQEAAETIRRVLAELVLEARGMDHTDPDIATAIGRGARAKLSLDWTEAVGLRLERLAITGAGYGLRGRARLGGLAEGLPLSGRLAGEIEDLGALAGLAGQPLSGALSFSARGTGTLLGGEIDAALAARSRDLGIGIAEADALLAGEGALDIGLTRDAGGITLHRLSVETAQVALNARGALAGEGGEIVFSARLPDLDAAVSGLSGALDAEGSLRLEGEDLRLVATMDGPEGARLVFEGLVRSIAEGPAFEGAAEITLPRLAPFAPLAGGRLTGAAEAGARLTLDTASGALAVDASGRLTDIAFGPDIVATLMRGETRIALVAARPDAAPPGDVARRARCHTPGGREAAGRAGAGGAP